MTWTTVYEVYGVLDLTQLVVPVGYAPTDDFRPALPGEYLLGAVGILGGKGHSTGKACIMGHYSKGVIPESRWILEKL